MIVESFSSFFKKKPEPQQSEPSTQDHVKRFHELHKELMDTAKHLHSKGYHMEVEHHDNPHAARHGRKSSTYNINQAVTGKHTLSVSRSAIAIDRSYKK